MSVSTVSRLAGLFCLVAILPGSVVGAEIEARSTLDAVTLHPDGAEVNRLLDVQLGSGDQTVLVRDLPGSLDANTIEVEGATGTPVTIVSVDVKPVAGDPTASSDPERARKLDALRAEEAKIAGRVEAAEAQKHAIARFGETGAGASDDARLPVADWPKAWAAIGDGMVAVNETLRGLQAEDRRIKAEIAALTAVDSSGRRPADRRHDLRLNLRSETVQSARLTIRYHVGNAGWSPLYDASLTTTGGAKPRLTLARRARVFQRTGEDWQEVKLSLSTVRRNRSSAAPSLDSLVMTLLDPAAILLQRQAREARAPKALDASPDAAQVAPPAPASAIRRQETSVEVQSYQARFEIPGRVTVPQDGTSKSFAISARSFEPDLIVKTVPALDPTAYLEAAFVNEDEAPLLPGLVTLRRDGALVGTQTMGLAPVGEIVKLGFGADEAVRVERLPVRKRMSDGGFLDSSRSDVQDYRTIIRNRHVFPVRISVIDRVPVSEDAALIVEPLPTNSPPTEKQVEGRRGVLGWSFDLKPEEAREIRLGWRLRWPADRELGIGPQAYPVLR